MVLGYVKDGENMFIEEVALHTAKVSEAAEAVYIRNAYRVRENYSDTSANE